MEQPEISIGIPIYYGEVYLKETLDNIIAQDFFSYEIVISDNNPGGEPEQLAKQYSDRYDFIHYHKLPGSKGALENWNNCIRKSKGKFYITAGGHDLWSTNKFLSTLYQRLTDSPEVAVAYAPSYFMKEDGTVTNKSTGFIDTCNQPLVNRFNMLFWSGQEPLYGLMRMDQLKKTRLQKEIIGSGAVWLGEIATFGDFSVDNTVQRYRRINRPEQDRQKRLKRYYDTLFSKKRSPIMPYSAIFFAYLKVPFINSELRLTKKIRLLLSVLVNYPLRYGHEILFDIKFLISRLFNSRK